LQDDENFDARITFLVYRVTAKLTLVANRLCRQYGLDIFSSRILLLLRDTGESAVGDLVEAMALPQSTISHQVLRLEKQGLISRCRSAEDNRVVRVALTDEGRKAAEDVDAFSRRINLSMIADLDPVQRIVTPQALRSLLRTLEREATRAEAQERENAASSQEI
jgi:DNA-binding MarR family transcriptional regulator